MVKMGPFGVRELPNFLPFQETNVGKILTPESPILLFLPDSRGANHGRCGRRNATNGQVSGRTLPYGVVQVAPGTAPPGPPKMGGGWNSGRFATPRPDAIKA